MSRQQLSPVERETKNDILNELLEENPRRSSQVRDIWRDSSLLPGERWRKVAQLKGHAAQDRYPTNTAAELKRAIRERLGNA